MSDDNPYSFERSENALGVEFRFTGPGMPPQYFTVQPIQPLNDWAKKCLAEAEEEWVMRQAQTVAALLNLAFQAGKEARSEEIDRLIRGSSR
jgi:hypothetical protein